LNLQLYTKEFGYNLRLAYPIILSMIGHSLVGFIDNVMVGQIGPVELAAVSLGNSFMFVAMSIGIGFSTAITPMIAENYGKDRVEENKNVFYSGLFLCTLLGVILFVILYFSKPLIALMGQPPEVVALAGPYMDIVALSLIPLIMFQAYKQFADGESETKYSMYTTVVANIVNVVFNYIFIFGFWIFPALGVIGAAIGTIASRIVMLVMIHYMLKHHAKFKVYFEHFSFSYVKSVVIKKIVSIGTPSSMQMLFEVALFTGAIWLSGSLGTFEQAANQIALSISAMTYMVGMGLSVAAMIRVGNCKGMDDYKEMRVVARSIFLLAAMFATFFALVFIVFHQFLPKIYFDLDNTAQLEANSEVILIASKLLLIAAVFQLSDSLQIVVLGALRGLQDVKIPMVLTFVAYWMIGFPTSVYLGLYTELKAVGIWIGLLTGLTFASLFLYLRFDMLTKKKMNEQ
jgi:multidrug resistance protein, MATE family